MAPNSDELLDVIVLLHGIRTRALWYDIAKDSFSSIRNVDVRTIGYGRFDTFRFLIPLTRRGPKQIVLKELRTLHWALVKAGRPFRISVLAHSFGTYNIIQILESEPDLEIHHLLLCGSVVTASYDFGRIAHQISGFIVNDVGIRDIWPVAARIATVGYGDSGSFGFLKGLVVDRFYNFNHGDFFSMDFIAKYWVPLFSRGVVIPSEFDRNSHPTPFSMNIISLLPNAAIPLALIPIFLAFIVWFFAAQFFESKISAFLHPEVASHLEHLNLCENAVANVSAEYAEQALTNYATETSSKAEDWCVLVLAEDGHDTHVVSLYARALILSGKLEKATAYFLKAADAGDEFSADVLSRYYSNYREPNESKSIYYFTLLASRGVISAYVRLGQLYETGIFKSRDYLKAANYYRQAADKGDGSGQYRLGQLYEFGLGVPKDFEKAKELYRAALTSGVEEAANPLARLNRRNE